VATVTASSPTWTNFGDVHRGRVYVPGPGTAHQVVAGSGTAVITGRDQDRVRAAIEALSQNRKACGITAELTDRDQVPEVGKRLAAEHADATLLINAAGFVIPNAFGEYDEALLSALPRATWETTYGPWH
jgi:NADP-dependent 3-hydroxy acid dehydrogenase YdfG